jgi:outer membrane lipoprotein-sorting protein
LALLAGAPVAAAELGPGVEEVQRCTQKNQPQHAARQHVAFERHDRAGNVRRFDATVLWKRDSQQLSRLSARVLAPPDERGTAFLAIERETGSEMWSYLPELRQVRRVNSRSTSSFLGTDVSYEDLQQLQALAPHARVERLPDATVDGRPVHVLASFPAPDSGSAYERIVSEIDQESCVALRTTFEASGQRVVKEILIDFADLERRGERWLPRKVRLRSLENGSETRMSIDKIELDPELPDRLFTQSELTKGR